MLSVTYGIAHFGISCHYLQFDSAGPRIRHQRLWGRKDGADVVAGSHIYNLFQPPYGSEDVCMLASHGMATRHQSVVVRQAYYPYIQGVQREIC